MVLPPRYTDARVLGEGSFGTVYAARDTVLDREVAVKLLRDDTARPRFAREIQIAGLVGSHPHVVTIHDAGEWRGLPYLVLELLEGRLHAGAPERVSLRWLAQAASALDFVHSLGIVHRDIKPANLLLDAHGALRVTDFGVAHTGTLTALTEAGAVVGTPGYIAPEVAAGGAATPASDLYALGVVARELLGAVPDRALAPDPADRYPTASALVAALGGDEQPTRVLFSRARTIARIPRTRIAPPIAQPRRRAVRRSVSVLGVAVIAAAAAAGGAFVAGRASATDGARTTPPRPQVAQTCALSAFHHNANVVVTGVGAVRFCRVQSHVLRLHGDEWTYRAGDEVFTPDGGSGQLQVICTLRRSASRLRVLDSGSHTIGTDLCRWYASGGWRAA